MARNCNRSCDDIEIVIEESQEVVIELDGGLSIIPQVRHDELENLDYEHSGHTGFASSVQLSILDNEVVKKRLNVLPDTDLTQDRSKMSIYIDNDGTPSKASLSDVLSKIIRTDTQKPSDMQVGEYLFKVQENINS